MHSPIQAQKKTSIFKDDPPEGRGAFRYSFSLYFLLKDSCKLIMARDLKGVQRYAIEGEAFGVRSHAAEGKSSSNHGTTSPQQIQQTPAPVQHASHISVFHENLYFLCSLKCSNSRCRPVIAV